MFLFAFCCIIAIILLIVAIYISFFEDEDLGFTFLLLDIVFFMVTTISGAYYFYKEGTVQAVYPKLNKVVVEGVNVHKKHKKPTQANPEGSVVEMYVPIDASNVAIVDPKTKKASRVGYKMEKGKKVRISKASGSKLN